MFMFTPNDLVGGDLEITANTNSVVISSVIKFRVRESIFCR